MIHGDLLGERARLTPGKTALVTVPDGQRLSYAELDRRACRCAAVWRGALGLEKGDRVALLAHNRVEFIDAFFAAGKSGVVLVPLGTRLTAGELAEIIDDAGARALIYGGAFAGVVRQLRQEVELERWIALDEPATPGDAQFEELCRDTDPASWARERCSPEDPHCLLYTSGTTGRPKGVIIPQRMVSWNGYNTACGWQLEASDVSPIFTPLYHAGGLGAFLTPIFAIGGTIVLHRGFDPAEIWRTIERERCTVVLGVPTIWKLLLEAPEFETVRLDHVRWFISGGAPLPRYLIEAYQRRGVVFKQGFGMTEVGVNCFAMSTEDSVRKAGSIGRPMMFTEVRLVDGKGRDVPPGEVGEMFFRGPHVARGYWRRPQATAETFDDEGWLHSGDLARRDEEGFFYIAGRSKDMIISGGVNVYPAEIEAALLLHPGVEEAAVVGIPDEKWGEIGVAFLVPRADAAPPPEELGEHLGRSLARYKIPRDFRLLDRLPRTSYGKVVKGELREAYLAERR